MNATREKALEIVHGAYDLHTHSTPSHAPRLMDDFELLRCADQYGLKGVMFKCHYEPTGARAILANLYAGTKAKAYSSISLNWPVGGINPYAAESCLKLGGKMVWMPTFDSAQFMSSGLTPSEFFKRPGITIFDGGGNIVPAVFDVFDVVKKYDCYLATGHLSEMESIAICRAGRAQGVKMILTHPDFARTPISLGTQLELSKLGVLVEKVWLNVVLGDVKEEEFVDSIKQLGRERVFLVTDRGQAEGNSPPEALVDSIEAMLAHGLSKDDCKSLICDIPARIVE